MIRFEYLAATSLTAVIVMAAILSGTSSAQDDARRAPAATSTPIPPCPIATTGKIPLSDLGTGFYRGFQGGLYPSGENTAPSSYQALGVAAGALVQPLDATGQPSPVGTIGVLGIGMSNARLEFARLTELYAAHPQNNPRVTMINAGHSGMTLEKISNPGNRYWPTVAQDLIASGVVTPQIQVVWLKNAMGGPYSTNSFPSTPLAVQTDLGEVIDILKSRYPNLRLVFISSRVYGGWVTTKPVQRGEPTNYEQSFGFKWAIEERINQGASDPFVDWGPYLWADGLAPRSDGLTWECADFQSDGVHPSDQGQTKAATLVLNYLAAHPSNATWFLP